MVRSAGISSSRAWAFSSARGRSRTSAAALPSDFGAVAASTVACRKSASASPMSMGRGSRVPGLNSPGGASSQVAKGMNFRCRARLVIGTSPQISKSASAPASARRAASSKAFSCSAGLASGFTLKGFLSALVRIPLRRASARTMAPACLAPSSPFNGTTRISMRSVFRAFFRLISLDQNPGSGAVAASPASWSAGAPSET